MAKFDQCFHRNLGRAERTLRALWIQHPGRDGESAAIDELAHCAFSAFTSMLLRALINAQRLAEEGMPTVVHRDSLKNMGIM